MLIVNFNDISVMINYKSVARLWRNLIGCVIKYSMFLRKAFLNVTARDPEDRRSKFPPKHGYVSTMLLGITFH